MLAIANCQAELKDTKAARKTIEDLVKAYPKSEAAQAGASAWSRCARRAASRQRPLWREPASARGPAS
jgi:hypothetical protein